MVTLTYFSLSCVDDFRNLLYECDEDQLQEGFSQFGDVNYARIVTDPKTNHSRGACFELIVLFMVYGSMVYG